jgi:hypothetical protein
MFGFPWLQWVVENSSGSEHLIDECLTELREFVGSDWEQEDDITLVTLKRATSGRSWEQGNPTARRNHHRGRHL